MVNKAIHWREGIRIRHTGREVEPGTDALSPSNKIVIAAGGALAGLAPPASAKTIVGAKSPLSNVIHDTSVGEWFSYMMRGGPASMH